MNIISTKSNKFIPQNAVDLLYSNPIAFINDELHSLHIKHKSLIDTSDVSIFVHYYTQMTSRSLSETEMQLLKDNFIRLIKLNKDAFNTITNQCNESFLHFLINKVKDIKTFIILLNENVITEQMLSITNKYSKYFYDYLKEYFISNTHLKYNELYITCIKLLKEKFPVFYNEIIPLQDKVVFETAVLNISKLTISEDSIQVIYTQILTIIKSNSLYLLNSETYFNTIRYSFLNVFISNKHLTIDTLNVRINQCKDILNAFLTVSVTQRRAYMNFVIYHIEFILEYTELSLPMMKEYLNWICSAFPELKDIIGKGNDNSHSGKNILHCLFRNSTLKIKDIECIYKMLIDKGIDVKEMLKYKERGLFPFQCLLVNINENEVDEDGMKFWKDIVKESECVYNVNMKKHSNALCKTLVLFQKEWIKFEMYFEFIAELQRKETIVTFINEFCSVGNKNVFLYLFNAVLYYCDNSEVFKFNEDTVKRILRFLKKNIRYLEDENVLKGVLNIVNKIFKSEKSYNDMNDEVNKLFTQDDKKMFSFIDSNLYNNINKRKKFPSNVDLLQSLFFALLQHNYNYINNDLYFDIFRLLIINKSKHSHCYNNIFTFFRYIINDYYISNINFFNFINTNITNILSFLNIYNNNANQLLLNAIFNYLLFHNITHHNKLHIIIFYLRLLHSNHYTSFNISTFIINHLHSINNTPTKRIINIQQLILLYFVVYPLSQAKTILNEIILPFYTKQHTTLIKQFIHAVTSIPHNVCPSENSNYDINKGLVYIKLNQILIRNIALLNKTEGVFFKTIFDNFTNTMFSGYLNTNDNDICLECNTLILTSIKLYKYALLNNDERNILNCVLPRNNEKYINECLKFKTFDGLIMLFNKQNIDFVPSSDSDTILEKMIYFIMKYSSNIERCKYMLRLGLNRVMRMDIKWLFYNENNCLICNPFYFLITIYLDIDLFKEFLHKLCKCCSLERVEYNEEDNCKQNGMCNMLFNKEVSVQQVLKNLDAILKLFNKDGNNILVSHIGLIDALYVFILYLINNFKPTLSDEIIVKVKENIDCYEKYFSVVDSPCYITLANTFMELLIKHITSHSTETILTLNDTIITPKLIDNIIPIATIINNNQNEATIHSFLIFLTNLSHLCLLSTTLSPYNKLISTITATAKINCIYNYDNTFKYELLLYSIFTDDLTLFKQLTQVININKDLLLNNKSKYKHNNTITTSNNEFNAYKLKYISKYQLSFIYHMIICDSYTIIDYVFNEMKLLSFDTDFKCLSNNEVRKYKTALLELTNKAQIKNNLQYILVLNKQYALLTVQDYVHICKICNDNIERFEHIIKLINEWFSNFEMKYLFIISIMEKKDKVLHTILSHYKDNISFMEHMLNGQFELMQTPNNKYNLLLYYIIIHNNKELLIYVLNNIINTNEQKYKHIFDMNIESSLLHLSMVSLAYDCFIILMKYYCKEYIENTIQQNDYEQLFLWVYHNKNEIMSSKSIASDKDYLLQFVNLSDVYCELLSPLYKNENWNSKLIDAIMIHCVLHKEISYEIKEIEILMHMDDLKMIINVMYLLVHGFGCSLNRNMFMICEIELKESLNINEMCYLFIYSLLSDKAPQCVNKHLKCENNEIYLYHLLHEDVVQYVKKKGIKKVVAFNETIINDICNSVKNNPFIYADNLQLNGYNNLLIMFLLDNLDVLDNILNKKNVVSQKEKEFIKRIFENDILVFLIGLNDILEIKKCKHINEYNLYVKLKEFIRINDDDLNCLDKINDVYNIFNFDLHKDSLTNNVLINMFHFLNIILCQLSNVNINEKRTTYDLLYSKLHSVSETHKNELSTLFNLNTMNESNSIIKSTRNEYDLYHNEIYLFLNKIHHLIKTSITSSKDPHITGIINKSFININQNLTESELQFRNLSNELLTYLHHKLSQKSNNSSFTIPSSHSKFLTQILLHNNTKQLTNKINTFVEHIINELKGTIYETFFNAYPSFYQTVSKSFTNQTFHPNKELSKYLSTLPLNKLTTTLIIDYIYLHSSLYFNNNNSTLFKESFFIKYIEHHYKITPLIYNKVINNNTFIQKGIEYYFNYILQDFQQYSFSNVFYSEIKNQTFNYENVLYNRSTHTLNKINKFFEMYVIPIIKYHMSLKSLFDNDIKVNIDLFEVRNLFMKITNITDIGKTMYESVMIKFFEHLNDLDNPLTELIYKEIEGDWSNGKVYKEIYVEFDKRINNIQKKNIFNNYSVCFRNKKDMEDVNLIMMVLPSKNDEKKEMIKNIKIGFYILNQ